MIVTGYSSGMVECRWHDGYGIKREAFREDELQPANKGKNATRLNHTTPGLAGRFTGRRLIISDGERQSGVCVQHDTFVVKQSFAVAA